MLKSKFCERVGTKYPIIQAGMGPFPTTDLAIASANAGVLGIMSSSAIASQDTMPHIYDVFCKAAGATRDEGPEAVIEKMFIKAFEQTKDARGIFGVNVMVSAEMLPWAKIVISTLIRLRNANPEMKERFKVLYTSAGDPLPWGDTVKQNDLTWAHIVPSVKGALRCKKAGVDIIVASGHESGFHTSWEPVHSMVLLPAVVEAINDDKTIVCGAGGFCDGKTLAAALLMGADGVQMGTRFLATQESDFAPLWKQSVVDAGDRATIVARGFVGPARWLKNDRSDLHAQNTLKYSPGLFIGVPDDDTPQADIDRLTDYENDSLNAAMDGDTTKAMMAAGECAQRINDMPKVSDLVQQMVGDAEKVLKGASALVG